MLGDELALCGRDLIIDEDLFLVLWVMRGGRLSQLRTANVISSIRKFSSIHKETLSFSMCYVNVVRDKSLEKNCITFELIVQVSCLFRVKIAVAS